MTPRNGAGRCRHIINRRVIKCCHHDRSWPWRRHLDVLRRRTWSFPPLSSHTHSSHAHSHARGIGWNADTACKAAPSAGGPTGAVGPPPASPSWMCPTRARQALNNSSCSSLSSPRRSSHSYGTYSSSEISSSTTLVRSRYGCRFLLGEVGCWVGCDAGGFGAAGAGFSFCSV